MLPKRNRLSRSAFTAFSSLHTKTVYNNLGTLKYRSAKQLSFSVVTSSKSEKKAVLRNKLRRRIYSIVADCDKKFSLPIVGVLYVSKQSYTFLYEELRHYVQDLASKIKTAS